MGTHSRAMVPDGGDAERSPAHGSRVSPIGAVTGIRQWRARFAIRASGLGLSVLGAVALCGTEAWAADTQQVQSPGPGEWASYYSLGYQLGRDLATLKRLGMSPDLESILKGLSDGLAGVDPSVGVQAMNRTLAELRQNGAEGARTKSKSFEDRATDAFHALHAGQEAVVTLPSGLQYRVIRAGGGRRPMEGDVLTVHYRASLANGILVESTYQDDEPARLRLGEVMAPGLKEALSLMREGGKWDLFIPPVLGFSEYSTLRDRAMIYEVELVAIEPAGTVPAPVSDP